MNALGWAAFGLAMLWGLWGWMSWWIVDGAHRETLGHVDELRADKKALRKQVDEQAASASSLEKTIARQLNYQATAIGQRQ